MLRPLAVLGVVLATVSLLLAFGKYTPLFRLTTKIPVIGLFRVPARYLALFQLGVAMLGTVAFAGLCGAAGRERPSWRRLWPLALPPIASLLACLAPGLPKGLWPSSLRARTSPRPPS